MPQKLTLGSLFDGIGGWIIAAKHDGVTPVWASEIDSFPAAVTAHHHPEVIQLGDITKINPDQLKPVDIVCAGSPCQDLSIAGKRAGLDGERSGLFHAAIKLVRRMRKRTGKPWFFVWENVPGAFSSNRGLDFKAVLEEISEAEIPMPEDNKWAPAGVVEWDGGSLAWRVLDAQYWGVPQRRKRIFLVADFAGQSAGEILFESEDMPGDSAESERARKGAAGNAGESVEGAGGCLTPWGTQAKHIISADGKAQALSSGDGHGDEPGNIWDARISSSGTKNWRVHCYPTKRCRSLDTEAPNPDSNQGGLAILDLTHHDEVVRVIHGNKTQTLKARAGTGGNNTPIVFEPGIASRDGGHVYEGVSPTLRSDPGDNAPTVCLNDMGGSVMGVSDKAAALRAENHGHVPVVSIAGNTIDRQVRNGGNGTGAQMDISYTLNTIDRHAVCVGNGQFAPSWNVGKAGALNTMHDQQCVMTYQRVAGTLCVGDYKGPNSQYVNQDKCIVQKSVRRLTPLECERLQGLSDGYTDIEFNGKPALDSKRYKALGNGMAQPCADYVIQRIVAEGGENIGRAV